jgi:threonine aldolase
MALAMLKAFKNMILLAQKMIETDLCNKMKNKLSNKYSTTIKKEYFNIVFLHILSNP